MSRRKRIIRIIIHLSLILVWIVVVYLGLGAPSFTAEMAMRRHEAAQWVGPSKVIAEGELPGPYYTGLLVGETDYGYCLYEYKAGLGKQDNGYLNYIPKDDPRICFMQNALVYGAREAFSIYSLSKVPGAVSARLTLESQVTYETEYTLIQTAQSDLQDGVYYRFEIDMSETDMVVPQAWNLWLIGENWSSRYVKGTLRMEYFDRDGNLITTQEATYPVAQN